MSRIAERIWSLSTLVLVVTVIVGAIVGSGVLVQWQHLQLMQTSHELEKARHELGKIPLIIDMHNRIDKHIFKIVAIQRKYHEFNIALIKNYSEYNRDLVSKEVENLWKYELPYIMDSITQLEAVLSKLENRESRMFDLAHPSP